MIVVFPGHAHLLFKIKVLLSNKGITGFKIFMWVGISLDIGRKFSVMATREQSHKT